MTFHMDLDKNWENLDVKLKENFRLILGQNWEKFPS